MLRIICFVTLLFFLIPAANAQKCFEDNEYEVLEKEIASNVTALERSGKLSKSRSIVQPILKWPMRQANGYDDFSYWAITKYVDRNPADTLINDYNCGQRTYDGHRGTDIAIAPFSWNKVAANQVEVIAAADGVIVKKHDGEFDENCVVDSLAMWNLIVLQHADGSQTWYGHLKTGFITAKDSGDAVLEGEYIGIVASSGKSTGPHLHFEVKNSNGKTTDPFDGPCNPLGNNLWWENQLSYNPSAVNKMMTSAQNYIYHPCPSPYEIFEKEAFNQGEDISFSIHYRSDLTANETTVTAVEPDGDINPMLDLVYSRDEGSYWQSSSDKFWLSQLPNDAEKGKWKFKAAYNTTTYGIINYEKEFWVKEGCTANKVLQGSHGIDKYYPTSNSITSTAKVLDEVHIVYDAENFTVLNPGFHAQSGSKLEVKTEGCN